MDEALRAERTVGGTASLSVYGLRTEIGGDWPEVVEDVARDFAWFAESAPGGAPALQVTLVRRPPEFDRFADLRAAFVTPRNVVYQGPGVTVVDYFGQALAILDRRRRRVVVQGEDASLVHEAAYQFLLSRIGEHLDARGLVRLHALGLSGGGGAIAIMLPSGGGKSTLCLRALRDPACRLLSEDSPLIDRHGVVHPFPLRIGINPTDAALMPDGNVRLLQRMEFHPKLTLDVDAFADRIEGRPQPLRHLVIGTRTLGTAARLEEVPGASPPGARCCARPWSASGSTRGWSSSCSAVCATWPASSAPRRRARWLSPAPCAEPASGVSSSAATTIATGRKCGACSARERAIRTFVRLSPCRRRGPGPTLMGRTAV